MLGDWFQGTKRFVIDGRLGAGGMGVVYRARDLERGETVALKTMNHLDPEALLRFKREFRSLADISHPNVVQLYELFSEEEHWFFTMELVDGVDLLSWVHSSLTSPPPPLLDLDATPNVALHPTVQATPGYFASPPVAPPSDPSLALPASVRSHLLERSDVSRLSQPEHVDRLREAFRQLSAGLLAIHAAGKLHRDVKPPNVLVARDGRVVLLDFGVAANFVDRSGHGIDDSLSGTPAYMAPEQASFTRATPATDWYAMGVVLYEALTQRLPFEGSPPAILFAKQQGQPLPPSAYLEGVPADLAELAMDLLVPEPRKRPSGDQIMARLEGERLSHITTPSEISFVGRQTQLTELRAAFETSKERLVIVMLHGRSGMGKSALASRFLNELAAKQDALMLAGRCYERETVPFKAIDPVVDELRNWLTRLPEGDAQQLLPNDLPALARVFPVLADLDPRAEPTHPSELDRAPPHELRRRAFAALRELLGNISKEYRLVLHIDDLQWCDADSVQLLEALFAPPSVPWMLTLSYRSEMSESPALAELRACIAKIGDACKFHEISVSELAPIEAGELARALLESKDDDVVALVTAEAGGNPLFLAELARYANDKQEAASGLTLEQVILDRFARLPEDARELLETLSVAGGPLTQRTAGRASQLDSRLRAPALALRGARLVVTRGLGDDDSIETAHDRVRETIAQSLGPERRRARHADIARALAAELPSADAEAIFRHYQAAGDIENARGTVLVAAAAADHALAFMRAAALYREAIRLHAGPLDRLHLQLGDALANAEHLGDAADAYLAGAPHARPDEALEMRRLAAEDYLKSGRDTRGLAVLKEVLREVDLPYPKSTERAVGSLLWHEAGLRVPSLLRTRTRTRAMRRGQSVSPAELARIDVAFSAATGLALSDPLRGADYAARGLSLALDAGEPMRLCRALALVAGNSAVRGEPGRARAEELVRSAERIAQEIAEPRPRALALLAAGTVHFFLGEWRSARSDLERADKLLRESCRAVAWELSNTQSWTCNVLILSGNLREAARRVPAHTDDARGREDFFAMSHLVYAASIASIIADDLEGALAASRSFSLEKGTWSAGQWGSLVSACSVDRYRDDGPGAWRRTKADFPGLAKSMLWRSAMVRVFSMYESGLSALASAAAGSDRGEALRAAEGWSRDLAKERLRYAPALGDLLRAGIAAVRGEKGRALDALDMAIPKLDNADFGYLAACARHRKGELTGGAFGQELLAQSRAFFANEGIVRVEKCMAMSAPGF